MGVRQDADDLRAHLAEQVYFLRSSAQGFDSGIVAEAKRLAHHLRLLLHHTRNSHALLHQLGVLDTMEFLDSGGEVHPIDQTATSTLTSMRISGPQSSYIPRYSNVVTLKSPVEFMQKMRDEAFRATHGREQYDAGAWRPFDTWWHECVIKDNAQETFTRKDLVLGVANTDGGSHVDPELREAYARLTRSYSADVVRVVTAAGLLSLGDPVPASIRQVTFEVDASVRRVFSGFEPGNPQPDV